MRTLYDEYTSGILAEYAYCIQLGHDMHYCEQIADRNIYLKIA